MKQKATHRVITECYCMECPERDDEGNKAWVCTVCRNAIVEEKNRLVQENQELRQRLSLLQITAGVEVICKGNV